MKKSLFGKTVLLILSLFCLFSFTVAILTSSLKKVSGEEAELSKEVSLDAEYGGTYSVEDVEITYKGVNKKAQHYVITPEGDRIETSGISVEKYGKYKLVYYADFSGEIKTVEKEIVVDMPLFSLDKEKDSMEYIDGVENSISYQADTENVENKKYSVVDKQITGAMLHLTEGGTASSNEIINFNNLSKVDPFIEFYILPTKPGVTTKSNSDYVLGTRDFGKMTITLTDVYDENNYLNIIVLDADNWFCYIMTSSRANQLSGWSYETNANGEAFERLMTNGRFGTGIRLSMTNVHYSNDRSGKDWSRSWCRFYMDYEEKTLYVETYAGKFKVLDYDDSTNVSSLWEGFSENRAKLTISCTQFAGDNPSNIVVSKLNGKDVLSDDIEDTDSPTVNINYQGYTTANIPLALLNHEYPIFDCDMKDGNNIGLIENISVTKDGKSIELAGNKFIPNELGEYVVTYSATDLFGNNTVNGYVVKAVSSLSDIGFGFKSDDIRYNLKQGEFIILPDSIASGGSGIVSYDVYALLLQNSEAYYFDNNKLLAEKPGDYLIQFFAKDYIGQNYAFQYTVHVSESDDPVFTDDVVLPRYAIFGKKIKLPILNGKIYNTDGSFKEIESSIKVVDGNGERSLSDNIFEVMPGTAYPDTVKVKYVASANSKTVEKVYEIKTVNAFNENKLDFTQYFVYSDCYGETTSSAMRLAFNNGGVAKFIREIITDNTEIKFSLPTEKNVDRVNVYFENAVSGKKIKMSYFVNGGKYTTFSVNDGVEYTLLTSFAGANTMTLTFNDLNKTVAPESKTVVPFDSYSDGSPFEGFYDRFAYVSFELFGSFENGEGCIDVTKVNSQNLKNTVTNDTIGPSVSLIDNRNTRILPGESILINRAVSYDVIDTYSYVTVSVSYEVSVDGKNTVKFLKADDGTELSAVSADKEYVISNLPTGKYSLVYTAKDGSGKSSVKRLSFEVEDVELPVIEMLNQMSNVSSVGKTIELSKASVTDNVGINIPADGGSAYEIYVLTSSGSYVRVVDHNYKFEKAGEYKFIYMALDKSGNMGTYIHYVSVSK